MSWNPRRDSLRNRMIVPDGNREDGNREEDLGTMLARIPTEDLRAFAASLADTISRAAQADDDTPCLRAIGFE